MSHETAILIILWICLLLSAYFSATETAFSSLNRIRLKTMAKKGDRRAELVLSLADDYDALLSTILIGNNIVNIAGASLATVLFVKWLGEDAGATASTVVTTIVVLIFGEVSPKSIAKESPERFAMFSAPFLRILVVILTPFNTLFGYWKKFLSRMTHSQEDPGITEEELLSIVEEAKEDGGIDEQENLLIQRALKFTEQTAADIFTPRVDITAVSLSITKEELADVFSDSGYSRLPAYEESVDHITGIIYQKDFYNYIFRSDKEIREIVRPALFVPQTKKISILLKELQQKKIHIAVVLDEYGITEGIVTMEDILEELVGEIWDEYDEVNMPVERRSDTEYIVTGRTRVEKVFALLEMEIPEEDPPTGIVNRWITDVLGKIPERGDSFRYQDYQITVMSVNRYRVEKVLFQRVA